MSHPKLSIYSIDTKFLIRGDVKAADYSEE